MIFVVLGVVVLAAVGGVVFFLKSKSSEPSGSAASGPTAPRSASTSPTSSSPASDPSPASPVSPSVAPEAAPPATRPAAAPTSAGRPATTPGRSSATPGAGPSLSDHLAHAKTKAAPVARPEPTVAAPVPAARVEAPDTAVEATDDDEGDGFDLSRFGGVGARSKPGARPAPPVLPQGKVHDLEVVPGTDDAATMLYEAEKRTGPGPVAPAVDEPEPAAQPGHAASSLPIGADEPVGEPEVEPVAGRADEPVGEPEVEPVASITAAEPDGEGESKASSVVDAEAGEPDLLPVDDAVAVAAAASATGPVATGEASGNGNGNGNGPAHDGGADGPGADDGAVDLRNGTEPMPVSTPSDPVDLVLQALIARAADKQVGVAQVAAELVEQAELEDREVDEVLADLIDVADDDEGPSSERLAELTLFNDAVPRRPGQLTDFDRLGRQAKKRVIIRVLCELVALSEDAKLLPKEPTDEDEGRSWPLARAVWPSKPKTSDDDAHLPNRAKDSRTRRPVSSR